MAKGGSAVSAGRLGEVSDRVRPRVHRGWLAVVRAITTRFGDDQVSIVAAGVAFHVLLALLPAMAAFVAIYGLVGDVGDVPAQLRVLATVLPADMVSFVGEEMVRMSQHHSGGLTLAAAAGLLLSLWSANGATTSLFVGLNVAYEARESRSLIRRILTSVAFTAGSLVFVAFVVAVLGAGEIVAAAMGRAAAMTFAIVRWPALVLGFAGALCLLYRFGPAEPRGRWRRDFPGTAFATVAWVITSAALSFYLGHFSHYSRTYGSLGVAIGLMLWLWLTALIILIGAEINVATARRAPP